MDPKQMTLSDLRKEIERLDAVATKGPWIVQRSEKDKEYTGLYIQTDDAGPYTIAEWLGYTPGGEYDFDFIALSRTALPELLRRLIVAEEALESIAESDWGIKTTPTATNALAEIRGIEKLTQDARP